MKRGIKNTIMKQKNIEMFLKLNQENLYIYKLYKKDTSISFSHLNDLLKPITEGGLITRKYDKGKLVVNLTKKGHNVRNYLEKIVHVLDNA